MHPSLLNSIGILCFAVLWRPVAAIGWGNTPNMRRILLAAQAGLDPNLVLDGGMDFHSLISHPPHQEAAPEAEYATVWLAAAATATAAPSPTNMRLLSAVRSPSTIMIRLSARTKTDTG